MAAGAGAASVSTVTRNSRTARTGGPEKRENFRNLELNNLKRNSDADTAPAP